MLRRLLLVSLVLATLTACSSVYWQDNAWDEKLLHAVQSTIHYPMDAAGNPIGAPATVHGKVKFMYADGTMTYLQMTESTGRPDLDAAMLKQAATAPLPASFGSLAKEPHVFALSLVMLSPTDMFDQQLYEAISAKRIYPKEAILKGAQGTNTIAFDYADGKAANVVVFKSSGDISLDTASIRAISNAQLPPRPTWWPHRSMNMRFSTCYTLGSSSSCPTYQHVVEVVDTPASDQLASPPSGP